MDQGLLDSHLCQGLHLVRAYLDLQDNLDIRVFHSFRGVQHIPEHLYFQLDQRVQVGQEDLSILVCLVSQLALLVLDVLVGPVVQEEIV